MRRYRHLVVVALLVGGAGLGACTAVDPGVAAREATAATAVVGPSAEPVPDTTPPSAPRAELPGETFLSGPAAGASLSVVGVRADDVLNVRAGPAVDFEIVGRLAPVETVTATGQGRIVGGSVWVELSGGGATGWADLSHLGYLGATTDVTSEFADGPAGQDVELLATWVVRRLMSAVPAGSYDVVTVDGPHPDVAEITVDIVGFGDDSVLGTRVRVVATSVGDLLGITRVETSTLCARGTTDGACQ